MQNEDGKRELLCLRYKKSTGTDTSSSQDFEVGEALWACGSEMTYAGRRVATDHEESATRTMAEGGYLRTLHCLGGCPGWYLMVFLEA